MTKANQIFVLGSNNKGMNNLSKANYFKKLSFPFEESSNDNINIAEKSECFQVQSICVGSDFFLAIFRLNSKLDSTIAYGWGSNEFGQLGLPNIDYVRTPIYLPNLDNFSKIICGRNICIGLKANKSSQDSSQIRMIEADILSTTNKIQISLDLNVINSEEILLTERD